MGDNSEGWMIAALVAGIVILIALSRDKDADKYEWWNG